jgi:hypothetical protein
MVPRRRKSLLLGCALSITLSWLIARWWFGLSGMYNVPDRLDDTVERTFALYNSSKYDHIALCVHVVDGTIDDARFARQQLRTAASAFRDPSETPPPYPVIGSGWKLPPLIDLGCPSEPVLLSGAVEWASIRPIAARADEAVSGMLGCCRFGMFMNRGPHGDKLGRRVADSPDDPLPRPSPYQIHVYIVRASLPLLTVDGNPSIAPFGAIVTEEYVTDGWHSHVASEVTEGAYLTIDQVADVRTMERLLEGRFQLKRRVPLPPDPNARQAVPAHPVATRSPTSSP